MYLSADHIGLKSNQDYADFICDDDYKALILCDGIGEFKDSGKVSKIVVERFLSQKYTEIKSLITDDKLIELKKNKEFVGGTTIITAVQINKKIKINYLGNGGIVHLPGDFFINQSTDIPYRYADLMLPHISPKGFLTKHMSHHSGKPELDPTEISLTLNNPTGDIFLFFSDGISSIEEKVIIKDDLERYWRVENSALQKIIKGLHTFLIKAEQKDFLTQLSDFNKNILQQLKIEEYLEDDAALGILITNRALKFYKSLSND
jgi:serine/threonine protein phosphatase PrpC